MSGKAHWHQFATAEDVAQFALQQILTRAHNAISKKGSFTLVLAGGTTPKRIYQLLSEQQQEWSRWHLFMGDERCLDVEDPQRNSVMIRHTWLDKVNFSMENFYPIAAEHGAEQGAREYGEIIRPFLPFDLTLLGIGEDGHTASLFPAHQHNENELTHAIYNSPKPPPERVSLSKKALAQSEHLSILVTGSGKKTAVKQWQLQEGQQGEILPVAQMTAINAVDVLIDQDALP